MMPTFLGITLLCFMLTRVLPGGPVEQALSSYRGIGGSDGAGQQAESSQVSESLRKQLNEHFGYDKPVLIQYKRWLWDDNLGLTKQSIKFPHKNVWELLRDRFHISLIFGLTGFILSYLVCIPLGIAKALRDGGAFDLGSSILIFIGYAIPAFAFGMILKLVFSGMRPELWDLFPVGGFVSDNHDSLSSWGQFKDIVWHMALPLLCYVIGNFAVLTVLMKNSLMDEISKDYVRTVVAKGGTLRRAIWVHALRNAMIPIATGIGGILTVMFAGSVVIERVFEIPGMGRLSLDAIVGRDYPVFMGILALTSILGLLGRILSDFTYLLIDPRIDFEK